MIRAELIGDAAVVAKLRTASRAVESNVRNSIARLTIRLQRNVRQSKLGGQVLKVRTGTLRRSIDQKVLSDAGAVLGIVSTNVKYGRAHEYGFNGSVTVKAHMRMVKQAWGRPLKSPHESLVKSHSRKVDLPERSFLRSALRELQPTVQTELRQAVANGIWGTR